MATDLTKTIIHLFAEAEHDQARLGMLMALRDLLGYGHNLGFDYHGQEVDWEQAVRDALAPSDPVRYPDKTTEKDT